MPAYDPPRNDIKRLAFLKRTLEVGKQDLAAHNAYVSQDSLTAIETFLPRFEAAVNEAGAKLGARAKEIEERVAAVERVKTYLRDLWEVIKRRAARNNEPVGVLAYYQLPQDGSVPNPTKQEEWLALADQVIAGDARAVAAGYAAAVCPSAAELQTVLTGARREANEAALADRGYDQAQEAAAALRPQADELITEVVDLLRFNTRQKDAPSQRRIMRTYGASFRYLTGETPDEEPPAKP